MKRITLPFPLKFALVFTCLVGLLPLWEVWHFTSWEAGADYATLYQALLNLPDVATLGWNYEGRNLLTTGIVLLLGGAAGFAAGRARHKQQAA